MAGGFAYALGWLALCLSLGAIALPVAARLLPRDPARGAGLAIPIALGALTLGTYWLGRLAFPPAPLAAVAVLAGGAALARRGVPSLPWRGYAEAALVFAAGFGLVVLLRSVHPAITPSGEMFWDFALLQSILGSPRLPPTDPWFAGEPVRYYYGGHLLVAALAALTDTPGPYAYNLGLATVYAALVTGTYGLAGAVAAAGGGSRRLAGLGGAFFAGFAGNLYTPIRLALIALPDPLGAALAAPLGIPPARVSGVAALSFVDATHFAFTNTDFPIYSAFIGSLHPHVMNTPFLVLAAGLLFAYVRTPAAARRRHLALLAATTPLVGLLALVNTWELPAACGLIALAVALSPASPASLVGGEEWTTPGRRWAGRLAAGVVVGVAAGAVGLLWVAPYVARGLAGDPGIGLFPDRSRARYFVIGYGGFLLAFGGYLLARTRATLGTKRERRAALLAVLVLVGAGLLIDAHGLAILGPVALAGWYLLAAGGAGFEALLVLAGAGLALLVEFVYVREAASVGRYNTVYKTYTQVWVLWAPAAGVALTRLPEWRWRRAFVAVLVVSLSLYGAGGVAAHFLTGGPSYHPGSPTLDGTAYVAREHPDAAAAIEWLSARPGRPTIVSAPVPEGRQYQFHAAPAASLTGLPTLVGWSHEADYRGAAAYRERIAVVDAIYAGTRAKRARLLRAHGVRYIWLGPAERHHYVPIDYSREPGITVAFERGNVTVYAVDHDALAG